MKKLLISILCSVTTVCVAQGINGNGGGTVSGGTSGGGPTNGQTAAQVQSAISTFAATGTVAVAVTALNATSGGTNSYSTNSGYATSAGTLAHPVNSYGGFVALNHLGTNSYYTSLNFALTNAVAGDTAILNGMLVETGYCVLPQGFTLMVNGATITNQAAGAGGSAIQLNDNVRILGPGNIVLNKDYSTAVWIGFTAGDPYYGYGCTNFYIGNLNISGYSDCLYFRATNYFNGVVENCTLNNWGYDSLNEVQTNGTVSGIVFNKDVVNYLNTPYYQNIRGMYLSHCSNQWNNCVFSVDDTAHALAAMSSDTTASNDIEIFNNCVFTAVGGTTATLVTEHAVSFYSMENCTFSAQAAASTAISLANGAAGTSNLLSTVNAFGITSPLNIGNAAAYVWASGGNITTAATHPENFFALPTLLTGSGSGLTGLNASQLTSGTIPLGVENPNVVTNTSNPTFGTASVSGFSGPGTNQFAASTGGLAYNIGNSTNYPAIQLVGTLNLTFPTNHVLGLVQINCMFGTTNVFLLGCYTNQ